MGKVNQCLKRLFIAFNALFAIFGGLMVYGLIKSSAYSHQMSAVGGPSVGWAWAFALGVLGISCLGIFAGHSEKPLALKIFAGFMGVGMIVMMIFGIMSAVGKEQMKTSMQDTEMVKALLHTSEMSEALNQLQEAGHCCGITGASDWGNVIPDSCACRSSGYMYSAYASGCKAKPQGTTGPNQIYAETCSKYIFDLLDMAFNMALGLFFGFAVVALLGLLISLLMVHQVNRHDDAGASFNMKGY
ncbi:tetraspanin-8 [Larimichthys crocea]|uniref:tetraspanin-8 n=1 Tax=Larimichthys crocea TaxID=215358 RepID=UPI000900AC51|nr:tetraspanin-8 [Larimichthys crocea]